MLSEGYIGIYSINFLLLYTIEAFHSKKRKHSMLMTLQNPGLRVLEYILHLCVSYHGQRYIPDFHITQAFSPPRFQTIRFPYLDSLFTLPTPIHSP